MDESTKRKIGKMFLPNEGQNTTADDTARDEFVEVDKHPFDKWRRTLRRAFPGMPDLILTKNKEDR